MRVPEVSDVNPVPDLNKTTPMAATGRTVPTLPREVKQDKIVWVRNAPLFFKAFQKGCPNRKEEKR